jgi:hypothetical protein
VCLGVLGLNSNIKFFPLKVHLVQLVHLVCIGTNTYVPVLPFVLQTLQQVCACVACECVCAYACEYYSRVYL